MSVSLIKRCTTPLLLASVIFSACKTGGSSGSSTNLASTNLASTNLASTDEGITVAVFLASHGDIDDTKGELEDYIKTAFKHNVGIPLPYWVRPAVTQPAYMLSVKNVKSQYDIIGPTHYRENSQKQIEALALALKEAGISARTYYGFNFAKPYISETMAQMQKDGIKKIIVYNQGAQCSWASQGENIGDVREYMKEHPEYDAEVIGYRQYSEDQRFRDLMVDVVTRDAKEKFPGVSASQVCILVGSHGLPKIMTDAGDPAIAEMRRAFDYMVTKMKPYRLYHGFLNLEVIKELGQPVTPAPKKEDSCKLIAP